MARIPNLRDRNDGNRRVADHNVLRIENDKGETLLFKPEEAKEVLRDYIAQELALEARSTVQNHREQLEFIVRDELQDLKNDMDILLHREINKMVEKIIHSVMQYNIEAEVDRRVKERLEKIFKDLGK